jgi:hypothetical protein
MKKIKEPLQHMTSASEMYRYVYYIYDKLKPSHYAKVSDVEEDPEMFKWTESTTGEILHEIGQLLWMRRYPKEIWEPPV